MARCIMCGRDYDGKTHYCNSCIEWVRKNAREPTAEERRDHLREWRVIGYDEEDGREIYRYD